jgi:biotin transport system substrate-specific component
MTQGTAVRLTLADRTWPGTTLWKDLAWIGSGALLIALLSQLVIPLTPVPVTGQTLAVLLVGAALGSRRGPLSLLTYLALGVFGMPVFAGGAAGLSRLAGPTAGYLAGFVLAAALVGWLCERGWDRRPATTFLAMVVGQFVIYVPGILWLSRFVGWPSALTVGLLPFLLGDGLKAALAALLLPLAWRVLEGHRS